MAIQQFSPPHAPFVDLSTGSLTQEASIFIREIWLRLGGASAPNNNELSVTEYADAGIEELKFDAYRLRDELGLALGQVAQLAAMVDVLSKRIEGLEMGVSI